MIGLTGNYQKLVSLETTAVDDSVTEHDTGQGCTNCNVPVSIR